MWVALPPLIVERPDLLRAPRPAARALPNPPPNPSSPRFWRRCPPEPIPDPSASACFFLIFTAFNAAQALATSLPVPAALKNLGNIDLSALYVGQNTPSRNRSFLALQ